MGIALTVTLGLMAVMTTLASAGFQLYTRSTPGGTETPLNSIGTFVSEKDITQKLKITALNTYSVCTEFSLSEVKIQSTGEASGTGTYKKCEVRSVAPDAKLPCTLTEPITVKFVALPALHENAVYYSFEPVPPATKFTTLEFSGAECTLPEAVNITGHAVAEDSSHHNFGVYLEKHLLQEAPHSLFSSPLTTLDNLKFGAQDATLEGSVWIKLSGAHSGLEWKVVEKETISNRLCKVNSEVCEIYPVGTKVTASLEKEVKFDFLYEGEELEPPCRVSVIKGATSKAGVPLLGEVSSMIFKECGGGLCTVTAQHLPYKSEFAETGSGNGTMTLSSGGGGQPAFAIKCLGLTKCIYGAKALALTLTGGDPAKLSNGGIALELEEGSEGACGASKAKWEGVAAAEGQIKYQVSTPKPLFVKLL